MIAIERGLGSILVTKTGQHVCHVCESTEDVRFLRFRNPARKQSQKLTGPGEVFLYACHECLTALAKAVA